ncbi:hypothetical protein ACHFJ0_05135 [Paracoccus sp. NGMCC 1.201697]|uniref:Uncharacterized protein n=1 Tax=Paracoccus broussonetiae subsp. drimophilus TaxID=3373869 RepID=A0ABW7LJY4_9RHOB
MMARIASWFTAYGRRKLEWLIAIYTVYFGIGLMLPPVSMAPRSFYGALALMSEQSWGAAYFAVGLLHAVALHVNGRAAWTPFARLGALFLNAQVFLAMTIGIAAVNPFSTGVLTYGFLAAGFCGAAIASAAHDCGREIKIWQGGRNGRI